MKSKDVMNLMWNSGIFLRLTMFESDAKFANFVRSSAAVTKNNSNLDFFATLSEIKKNLQTNLNENSTLWEKIDEDSISNYKDAHNYCQRCAFMLSESMKDQLLMELATGLWYRLRCTNMFPDIAEDLKYIICIESQRACDQHFESWILNLKWE
jgi:hypothetical protein